jgi:hypothetical protein
MENVRMSEITRLEKQKSEAFGKDVYLLGKGKDGTYYWLEAAQWSCSWYWGFGYIETYTNNQNPRASRDINSHQHWDSFITGKQEHYDINLRALVLGSKYVHHLNEHPEFVDTVLTDEESWKLAELMKTFYILKETAEMYHTGGAHLTTNPCAKLLKNKRQEDRINKILMPALFAEIYKILTPEYLTKE